MVNKITIFLLLPNKKNINLFKILSFQSLHLTEQFLGYIPQEIYKVETS